ncbi:hypothetical protein BC826DRAFT_967443 [Russula brevipes]|nr:hypothetical protein BC826DRAFT_967443 [Russula brevipes]
MTQAIVGFSETEIGALWPTALTRLAEKFGFKLSVIVEIALDPRARRGARTDQLRQAAKTLVLNKRPPLKWYNLNVIPLMSTAEGVWLKRDPTVCDEKDDRSGSPFMKFIGDLRPTRQKNNRFFRNPYSSGTRGLPSTTARVPHQNASVKAECDTRGNVEEPLQKKCLKRPCDNVNFPFLDSERQSALVSAVRSFVSPSGVPRSRWQTLRVWMRILGVMNWAFGRACLDLLAAADLLLSHSRTTPQKFDSHHCQWHASPTYNRINVIADARSRSSLLHVGSQSHVFGSAPFCIPRSPLGISTPLSSAGFPRDAVTFSHGQQ